MKQQLLIEKKKRLENELRGYIEEPSYLTASQRNRIKIEKISDGS